MTLLNCPFCGSDKVHVHPYNRPAVQCTNCLAIGPPASRSQTFPDNSEQAMSEAMDLWKKRAPHHFDHEIITDGWSIWPRKCVMCGKESMHVVRPGKVQCGNCD